MRLVVIAAAAFGLSWLARLVVIQKRREDAIPKHPYSGDWICEYCWRPESHVAHDAA